MSDRTSLQFKEVIGKGGFGTVFRATLSRPGGFRKEVAVKVLHDRWKGDPAVTARLRDEARVLGLLRHRALPAVDGLFWAQGRPALVVEFVAGVNLQQVRRSGPVPVSVVLDMVGEVANALHAAWNTPGPDGAELHLLHRDIKPSNLQLTRAGEVKLLDFGIARAEFDGREAETQGALLGSVRYMSPERLDLDDGPEGDIYALGVVLLEMILGEAPQKTSADRAKHEAFLQGVDRRLREQEGAPVPEGVHALVQALLAFDPKQRPTAREVERRCKELRRAIEGPDLAEWAAEQVPAIAARRQPLDEPTTLRLLGHQVDVQDAGNLDTPPPTLPESSAPAAAPRQGVRIDRRSWIALTVGVGAVSALLGLLCVALIASWWSQRASGPLPPEAPPVEAVVTAPPPTTEPTPAEPTPAEPAPAEPTPAEPPQAPAAPEPAPAPSPSPRPKSSGKGSGVVTGGAFASFLKANPEWTREEAIERRRAAEGYLAGWNGTAPPDPKAPATSVSWSAAQAFCASRGGLARLDAAPQTWAEGSGPFQEWRVADGSAAWRRFDGATSTAVRRSEANVFTGFRCAK